MHPIQMRATVSALLLAAVALSGCGRSEEGSEPPMRTTTKSSEWSVGGVVKGRTETTTTEPAAAEAPLEDAAAPVPDDLERQYQAQAGTLTAGDHDDLLNPGLFNAYASRFLQQQDAQLPLLDVRNRVVLRVTDAAGRAVPQARVSVQRAGAPLRLVTAAAGTAVLFPRFDRLPARTVIEVQAPGGTVRKAVELPAKGGPLALTVAGAARPVSAMDLVLVIDTTGSMADEMAFLTAELRSIVQRLKAQTGNVDLRIGLVAYRDEGDEYVVRTSPLTGDIAAVKTVLAQQEADGGGDIPEAVDQALAAADGFQWRAGAVKAVMLVADAPPHPEGVAPTMQAAERLRARGVQIVPVAASGVQANAEYLMRTMAALTQSRYIFLTDDSGVGNPHAEPDVSCYVVTHLDRLIVRVLAGIVEGRRIEPAPDDVVRTVGNYDRGRCLAPDQQAQR